MYRNSGYRETAGSKTWDSVKTTWKERPSISPFWPQASATGRCAKLTLKEGKETLLANAMCESTEGEKRVRGKEGPSAPFYPSAVPGKNRYCSKDWPPSLHCREFFFPSHPRPQIPSVQNLFRSTASSFFLFFSNPSIHTSPLTSFLCCPSLNNRNHVCSREAEGPGHAGKF